MPGGSGTGSLSTAGQIRYHDQSVNGAMHTILDLHTTNAQGGADHQIDLGVDLAYAGAPNPNHRVIHASDIIV